MTQDTSPDFVGTFQFLDRRLLRDGVTFGSLLILSIGILSSVSCYFSSFFFITSITFFLVFTI